MAYFATAQLGQRMITTISFWNGLYVNQSVDNFQPVSNVYWICLSLLPFMFEIDVNHWLNTCVFQNLGIWEVCLIALSTSGKV